MECIMLRKINLLQLFIRKQYVKTFIRENELFIQSSSFKHNPSNRKSPRQIKSCHSRLISQLEYSDEYNIIGLLQFARKQRKKEKKNNKLTQESYRN